MTPPVATKTTTEELIGQLTKHILGQPEALGQIAPYVTRYRACLHPEGRPSGVFMLLGPTGTGKTASVEALAEVIHGSRRNVLRIDCGEYQMDHEVAKLIGAPPGYLGHRETTPILTQARLAAVTSEFSSQAIVLFDEIEKACHSMRRLLLGVLDRGILRTGDNNIVNFERTLIFMTSNVGAAELASQGRMGLLPSGSANDPLRFARKEFAPEFLNRVDEFVLYRELDEATLRQIVVKELRSTQDFVQGRTMGQRELHCVCPNVVTAILARLSHRDFGARELKRLVERLVLRPATELFMSGADEVWVRVTRGELVVSDQVGSREVAA